MRLTSARGLAFRALIAVLINLVVLGITVGFVVAVAGLVLLNFLPESSGTTRWRTVAFTVGAGITIPGLAWAVRRTIRTERQRLFEETVPIEATSDETTAPVVSRLAAQFDLPEPAVRIRQVPTPLAYTIGRPDHPILAGPNEEMLVVSEGLLETLPADELKAVLAHELAHIANDDRRVVSWLLVPLIAAEQLHEDEGYPSSVFDIVGIGLAIAGQIAVGVFTRGRELAADRAAATALGDPSALAAALERLATATEAKPSTDLRRQARSTSAITVLPPSRADRRFSGLFSTHPPVETRLTYLRSLAA